MGGDSAAAADYDINQHHNHENRRDAGGVDSKPKFFYGLHDKAWNFFDRPVTWFRETFVDVNRVNYPWYHKEFPRVPTIDQCVVGDEVCLYEANMQFIRDRGVDNEIVNILRYRMDDCVREEMPDFEKCFPLKEAYEVAAANWFAKYGDLGAGYHVKNAFMKQKHRLIWERRHGKVGCGTRSSDNEVSAEPGH